MMGRRKCAAAAGSTAAAVSAAAKHRNVLAASSQHAREHLPTRDAGMHNVGSENQNDNRVQVLEDKPREEFHTFNNNNDSKYLHKKFKKMASATSTTALQEDHTNINRVPSLHENVSNRQSSSHPSSCQDAVHPFKRSDNPAILTAAVLANSSLFKYSVGKNSETENNVQINHKDYLGDSNSTAIRDSVKNNVNSEYVPANDGKLSGVSEVREVCETNSKDSTNVVGNGRHVCPYCKLSCAKPSVLQKHIRAHTNERPYPCVPCGFAFKTKSNLYKHCRSRSHALRLHGTEETPNNEEDWSLGSEADAANAAKSESAWSSDRGSVQGDPSGANENSGSELISSERISPSNLTNLQVDSKPKSIYKPKFHKASSFYQEEEDGPHKSVLSPNPDFLNRHISKIISDNEAIVDTIDSPFHRKYSKDNSNQKQSMNESNADLKNDNQPLNLTKNSEVPEVIQRKRCYSESFAMLESQKVSQHPLNPERSIIKDLLLKVRAQGTGLLPVTSESYDVPDSLYVCSLCQIPYKSADNLETHKRHYCKGVTSNSSNSVLNGNVSSVNEIMKFSRPDFMRSNSVHVTLPETYSPNTLAKIASSTLKSPFKRANKPENLVIFKSDQMEVATPLPSPGPLLGNTRLVDTQNISDGLRPNLFLSDEMEKLTRSSPILKRRSESQSSESMSSLSKISDEGYTRSEIYSPPNKIRCTETPTLRSLEELSLSPMRQNATSLQMFGGEVKIVDNAGGTTTMRIEPTSQHSPTFISQSRVSPLPSGPETSSILVRSGLHSGATIVHNPPTPKEPLPSPHPQTPRLLVSMAPNISTPNLGMAGIPAPNIPTFQFPIGPITAYNPLTLPALSPVASPSGATTILHRGKLIPYVPGMPGPNTLGTYSSPSQKLNSKMSSSICTSNTMSMDSGIIRSEKNFKDKLKNMNNSDGELNLKMTDLKLPPHVNMKNSINSLRNNEHLDKKETLNKYGDIISQNSPVSKSIPTIKVNYDDSSAALKSNQTFNKRMAEIKIDELLRKNTEILQKNPTNNMDFNSSKTMRTDFKSFQKVDKMSEEHIENKASPGFSMSSDREKRRIIGAEQFNFENLISKSEILNKPIESVLHSKSTPEDNSSKAPERSETSYFKKSINASSVGSLKQDSQSSKFLRPTTLPLKPGTFTPKKHHGITPNSNTLTLISPETPRPAKAYGQLYLNGHAYTYLGLKCSAKVYYCTLNRPQPTYVPNQHALSMYSNWQVCSESTPHPLGLAPGQAMAHYDSRHRPQSVTVSKIKQDHLLTHSSQWSVTVPNQQLPATSESDRVDDMKTPSTEPSSVTIKNAKSLAGGFESNEEYTYVPGRGRGRYVCSECGIRCKKPSMLKKHIRTHTDVRPFTCKHCSFSFKTKGNLTKHMKSKAHYRKCSELGINPLEGVDSADMSQNMGDSDDDSDTHDDGNEGETESSDTDSCKSRLEHEAAHCLLSLWGGRPAPGLLSTARPTTYPYTPNNTDIPSTSEDSKFSEPPVTSPLNENTSVIRKHPITQQLNLKSDKSLIARRSNSVAPMDLSKPKDFSKNDLKENNMRHEKPLMPYHPEDILTPVEEPDLLASLALSSSKLPRVNNWNNDEPMFQVYLTEKALQDSRIKQCQYTNGRLRQHEVELDSPFKDNMNFKKAAPLEPISNNHQKSKARDSSVITTSSIILQAPPTSDSLSEAQPNDNSGIQTLAEIAANSVRLKTPPVANVVEKKITNAVSEKMSGTENAKFVASEYLKVACGKSMSDHEPHLNSAINNKSDCDSDNRMNFEESISEKDSEIQKMNAEHIGVAPKVVVGAGGVGFKLTTPSSEFSSLASFSKGPLTEDGRSVCVVCNKTFSKPSQLLLHINIHYIERPFRCSACAVSFRTRGHLQKHERSGSHHNKVSMTSTFGAATTTNPRPFKCSDCKIAFRIHGHLAKHLRSKMHVMRLECLGKLPFGTFAEIERAGVSLTDIDTTDCDNSLASLQILAQKLHEKDPTKLEKWDPTTMTPPLLPPGPESSDEEEPNSPSPHIMSLGDNESKIVNDSDSPDETNVKYSATNT